MVCDVELLRLQGRLNAMNAILSAENITFAYREEKVLSGVSLLLPKGTVTGIVGPNGSGKSTLIKIMAGILKPDAGAVTIAGRSVGEMKRRELACQISVVPQEVVFYFPFSVFDFVMMGRHPYQGMTPFETSEDHETVLWALKQTGLEELKDRSVLELSGGEKQRTVLACSLAQKTPVMLLDEPTASLDLRYQVQIHKILDRQVKESGLTVAIVTHDLNLGALYCGRLLMMKGGAIVAEGPPNKVCTREVVADLYGVDVVDGINQSAGTPYILPTGK